MQVEELLRTHPAIGEFIAQTKAEAMDLTKQLETHIKSGYFEIVKAADQLMKLSSSVRSAAELICPLPSAAVIELRSPVPATRLEDQIWAEIDLQHFAEAAKMSVCATQPSDEMRDIYYYLREVCVPTLETDSDETAANKLAGRGIIHSCEQQVPDLGEFLLQVFTGRLREEIESVASALDFSAVSRLDALLWRAQEHFAHCFLSAAVAKVLQLNGEPANVTLPAAAEELIRSELATVVPKTADTLTAAVLQVEDPMEVLKVRFAGEERFGIFSLKRLMQGTWLQQLQRRALARLTELQFLQALGSVSPHSLTLAYEDENGALLTALNTAASDAELRPTISAVVVSHLQELSVRVAALVERTQESALVLTLAYFLHSVQTASESLLRLRETLGVETVDRHLPLLEAWKGRVEGRDTLSILREVRKVCQDDVLFCESVLPACAGALDSSKSGISAVFGLPASAEVPAAVVPPLADLPPLPLLQLLPRFSPHLVYS